MPEREGEREAGERLAEAIAAWCRTQHDGEPELMLIGAYVTAEVTTVEGGTWLHNGGLLGDGSQDTAAWQRVGWLTCALWNEQNKWEAPPSYE